MVEEEEVVEEEEDDIEDMFAIAVGEKKKTKKVKKVAVRLIPSILRLLPYPS